MYMLLLAVCYEGQVQFVGGPNRAEGRVEVCQNNAYGTICDEGWDDQDAKVACRSASFFGK